MHVAIYLLLNLMCCTVDFTLQIEDWLLLSAKEYYSHDVYTTMKYSVHTHHFRFSSSVRLMMFGQLSPSIH